MKEGRKMSKRKEIINEKIDELVRRIVNRFHPEKVILFGSHARGTAGEDSDADVLVVMPVKGSKRKKANEIDVALVGIDLPVDVIVVTPEELEKHKNQIGTIIYPALREGKVLYEKAA
jgi:predicted nucleotidyltransferase